MLQKFDVPKKEFEEQLDTVAQNAFSDPCTVTKPRETFFEQMKELFKASYYGKEALVKG